jgi:hypothetical protein
MREHLTCRASSSRMRLKIGANPVTRETGLINAERMTHTPESSAATLANAARRLGSPSGEKTGACALEYSRGRLEQGSK